MNPSTNPSNTYYMVYVHDILNCGTYARRCFGSFMDAVNFYDSQFFPSWLFKCKSGEEEKKLLMHKME